MWRTINRDQHVEMLVVSVLRSVLERKANELRFLLAILIAIDSFEEMRRDIAKPFFDAVGAHILVVAEIEHQAPAPGIFI